MVRVVMLLLIAVVMFASAAGASWWWQQQQEAAAPAPEIPPPLASAEEGEAAPKPADPAEAAPDLGLPVPVRRRPMSIEELLRYGLSLNAREETLEQREEEFRRRETQLKLALADLQGEQKNIDGLRAQVQQQLETADVLIARIQQGRQELAQDQADAKAQFETFQATQSELTEGELANIKKMSTWIRAMEPAKAGELLREMANDGRMDTAVRILSHLEERDAAKILDSVDDTALIDDLILQYQKLRPQAKPPVRR